MSEAIEPVPFEVYRAGTYLHGTKADLAVGDVLTPGRDSNFESGRVMNHVYFTETLDAATWGAELSAGAGRGRIYIVEPLGDIEDDPNVTDRKFPGNPTRSFRSRHPLRVVGELDNWIGHPRRFWRPCGMGWLPCSGTARRRSTTEKRPSSAASLSGTRGCPRGVPD